MELPCLAGHTTEIYPCAHYVIHNMTRFIFFCLQNDFKILTTNKQAWFVIFIALWECNNVSGHSKALFFCFDLLLLFFFLLNKA